MTRTRQLIYGVPKRAAEGTDWLAWPPDRHLCQSGITSVRRGLSIAADSPSVAAIGRLPATADRKRVASLIVV